MLIVFPAASEQIPHTAKWIHTKCSTRHRGVIYNLFIRRGHLEAVTYASANITFVFSILKRHLNDCLAQVHDLNFSNCSPK